MFAEFSRFFFRKPMDWIEFSIRERFEGLGEKYLKTVN